jgi:hypothetical protein
MSVILALVLLFFGFCLGRLYQWIKFELLAARTNRVEDPMVTAHRTASEMAAATRRAEEQIRRLGQRPGTRPRPR